MRVPFFEIAAGLVLTVSAFGQGYGPDMGAQIGALSEVPATHTGFVFDRSMLQNMQGVLAGAGVDAQRAAASVTGVTVDRYTYQQPAFYAPEAMGALMGHYKAMGWKHLVNANQTAENTAQPRQPVTDLWIHFNGPEIDGVTVLMRSSHEMNVVRLTGELRPLDLLKLSGHFGIPKVDPSAVMVPDGR